MVLETLVRDRARFFWENNFAPKNEENGEKVGFLDLLILIFSEFVL